MKRKKSQFREDAVTYLQMIHFLNEYNPKWKVILIGVLLEGIFPFIAIFLSSMLLDALYAGRSMQEMILLILAGTGASFITATLRHIVTKKKNIMWWGMQHRMTEPIMTKTMQLDYEQIGDERVRTLRARQDEYRKREKDVFERFLTQIEILLTAAVRMVAAVITIGPFLARQFSGTAGTQETVFRIAAILALLAVLYLNRLSVLKQGKRRLAIHREHEDENRLNSYMMNEVVLSEKAGKDIRIFNQEPMMEHYGDQMNANWRRMTLQYAQNDVRHFGLQGMLSSCVGGIIYLYVAFCAYGGMITIGNVVRYAGAVQQFIQGMTDLFSGWSRLHHDRMQMDEYLEYMGLQNKMKNGTRPVCQEDMENPEVEFVHVSFRYPGAKQYVLRDVNVKISERESTAFVGLNGSGKTTFIKLLCRLYDLTEGQILLNGVDIREYDEEQYRKMFAVVFQDFKIFSFRFGENIAAGENVDEARAMDAIRRVDLMRLYHKMPEGLNTMLNRDFSETGMEISGGEAQKTAMARAIYKDAPFVILDEPTAALDPIAESEIYSDFHRIVQDKTALFISHRLSACQFANDIIVFCDGKIVQQGSHKTLICEEGLYRKMWNVQAQYYESF